MKQKFIEFLQKKQIGDVVLSWSSDGAKVRISDVVEEFINSQNSGKPIVSGSLEVDFRVLLSRVVNLFGKEYGKGKTYDHKTLGGSLIEDIKKKLRQ